MHVFRLHCPALGQSICAHVHPSRSAGRSAFVSMRKVQNKFAASPACITYHRSRGPMPACRHGAQQQAARCPGHLNVRRAPLSLLRESTCNLQRRSFERTKRRAHTTANAASSSYEDRSTVAKERATSSGGSSSDAEGAPVQFEIHRIAGDGSCLFRAVAQGTHHVSTGEAPLAHIACCATLRYQSPKNCSRLQGSASECNKAIRGIMQAVCS